MRNKIYHFFLIVGVALIITALFIKGKDNDIEQIEPKNGKIGEVIKKDGIVSSGTNYLEGVLRNSENPNRGNLKLISKQGDIYLRTSRDFSSLVGFQVLVLINGTHENFELLDIQSKIADEGFIRAQ